MKDLINEVELHWIKYVFSEPQFSNGWLKKFSNTYNLTIGLLDPLWVDESADGYMNTLRSNLNSLIYIYE
jgi:ABC-type Zn uptake system ZnuABC Zn-binding protein ZnuA